MLFMINVKYSLQAFNRLNVIILFQCKGINRWIDSQRLADSNSLPTVRNVGTSCTFLVKSIVIVSFRQVFLDIVVKVLIIGIFFRALFFVALTFQINQLLDFFIILLPINFKSTFFLTLELFKEVLCFVKVQISLIFLLLILLVLLLW